MPRTRSTKFIVASGALVVGLVMSAVSCQTGPRPTFGPATTEVSIADPAITDVMNRLASQMTSPFTVTYDTVTKFGGRQSTAQVTFDPELGYAVLIDSTLFVFPVGDISRTCRWSEELLVVDGCVAGIDETRVSDLGLNSRSFTSAASDRLRQDAQVATGQASARSITEADHDAVCADVPVVDGSGAPRTKSYCAFADVPVISSLDTADLSVVAVFVDDIATVALLQPNSP